MYICFYSWVSERCPGYELLSLSISLYEKTTFCFSISFCFLCLPISLGENICFGYWLSLLYAMKQYQNCSHSVCKVIEMGFLECIITKISSFTLQWANTSSLSRLYNEFYSTWVCLSEKVLESLLISLLLHPQEFTSPGKMCLKRRVKHYS